MDMYDREAQTIVTQALALTASHAHAPALDILDLAMAGHHGSDPVFSVRGLSGYDDHTDPASPFGELLRRAFASDELGPATMARWTSNDPADATAQTDIANRWQSQVLDRFARRYRLWGTDAEPAPVDYVNTEPS